MTIGIYCVKNITNGKCYVGQSTDIEGRWNQHLNQYSKCTLLLEDMRIFCVENFELSILETLPSDKEQLQEREKYWIKKLNSKYPNGYNVSDGGNGMFGSHSEISKQKISISNIGKVAPNKGIPHSEETRRKISDGHIGKSKSLQTREKMSAAQIGNKKGIGNKNRLGKLCTDETKKLMRESAKTRPPISEETRLKMSESARLSRLRRKENQQC